ncbi:MAG: aminoglycoside phosphotransferase family protein [Hymenobacter sp.]|nr:MAG: aminoglycoside phosphotransferase family protein [Hymenobacter sp.]
MFVSNKSYAQSAVPTVFALDAARKGLRPVSVNQISQPTLPVVQTIFPDRSYKAKYRAWHLMYPCRVSPVWEPIPELKDFDFKALSIVNTGLAKQGHTDAVLTPMLAGYSGAQPFKMKSEKGEYFVKAVLDGDVGDTVSKLAKEYYIGTSLASAKVGAQYFGFEALENVDSPNVAFLVSSLLQAGPLGAQPFRSELFKLAKGGESGPFLQQLLHLLRGFHKTEEPNLLSVGPCGRGPLQHFTDIMKQASEKGYIEGFEQQALQSYQNRLIAAYKLRGGDLEKNHVFIHADMHASNIRRDWQSSRLYAIDFGDSGMGDPARELAYFLFMMDVPMALASPLIRLYQREVTRYPEAFYERTLLALASERITRYVKILGWGGREKQEARDYQRRIEDDLPRVATWI